ncbi:MAG TPA: hypothetical protein VMU84_00860, partial [Thermoanaerobaculia bacterium]|nr:hypothetical protein [Thermoanaerobaculia bacterium]
MNVAHRIALALALILIAALARGDDNGMMCIAAGDMPFDASAECFATTTTARIAVQPSKEKRRFVWTSPARQDLVLGVILPGDQEVVFADTRRGVMQLDLTGSPHRDWPAKSTLQLTERDLGRWTFTLDEKQVVTAVTLHLPRGVYDLVVTAAGHRVMKHDGLKIAATNAQPEKIKLTLASSMRVIATIAAAGNPVAWAKVIADCDRPLCESAVDGRVRCDVPDPPPRMLCIEQAQFGRRRILIDSSRLDIDLGTVELTRSSTLIVERPPHIELPAETRVTLFRARPSSRPAEIAKRPLD